MAGDWIKMRSDLFTHPKVVRMASALKADGRPDVIRVVGGLMSVWCLFDAHSVDGILEGYSPDLIDDHLRWDGFSEAMQAVGWLAFDAANSSMSLPDFDKHNGQSAKRRAQDADRKREDRKTSASQADEKRTREEKRREEINTPKAPKGAPDGFDAFWAAYPNKVGKGAAVKAFAKISPSQDMLRDMLAALADQKCSVRWLKDGGQYVPNPATWLNQQRWLDEGAGAGESGGGLQLAGAL